MDEDQADRIEWQLDQIRKALFALVAIVGAAAGDRRCGRDAERRSLGVTDPLAEARAEQPRQPRRHGAPHRRLRGLQVVDHSSHEYVRGDVTSNHAESFFAQFKRSLDGTYHNVSKHHLAAYVTEFEHRWNTRKMSDHQRVQALVSGATGRRLTYRPLTEG